MTTRCKVKDMISLTFGSCTLQRTCGYLISGKAGIYNLARPAAGRRAQVSSAPAVHCTHLLGYGTVSCFLSEVNEAELPLFYFAVTVLQVCDPL